MVEQASIPTPPRPRLLAIDTATDVHRRLKSSLRGERVEIHGATTAEAGLKSARAIAPDVILLDIDLPDLDGFATLERLKADAATREVPVIFLSSADKSAVIRALDMGAIDCVAKPFDVSELKARVRSAIRIRSLIRMLAQRAQIDGLTGLWNRAHFDQRLHEEVVSAQRHGTPLALILADLDRFKRINDTLGHPFGDRVLEEAARVLAAGRAGDVACRYGGEEFAIILPRATAAEAAYLAERLRENLRAQRWDEAPDLVVTASFGVADLSQVSDGEGGSVRALVERADAALYAAKQGRDRVVVAGEHGGQPVRAIA